MSSTIRPTALYATPAQIMERGPIPCAVSLFADVRHESSIGQLRQVLMAICQAFFEPTSRSQLSGRIEQGGWWAGRAESAGVIGIPGIAILGSWTVMQML